MGLFAAIFDQQGKILIKRRPSKYSLPGDWDLPGGAVEEEKTSQALDERIVGEELAREVWEEIGIKISVDPMPPMYPAILRGGKDWAFVIPVGVYDNPGEGEESQEIIYVSPEEVRHLADNPQGNRIVSGWGKRMSRLILMGLIYSPNENYQREAKMLLKSIQQEWR